MVMEIHTGDLNRGPDSSCFENVTRIALLSRPNIHR